MSCKKCFEEVEGKLGTMPGAYVLHPDDHTAQIRAETSEYIQKRLPWLPADKVEAAVGRVQAFYINGRTVGSNSKPNQSFNGGPFGLDYELLMPDQQNGVWAASQQLMRETGESLKTGDEVYIQLTINHEVEPFLRRVRVGSKDRFFGSFYSIEGMHEKTELQVDEGGRRGKLHIVELAKPPGGALMEQPRRTVDVHIVNSQHGGFPAMPVPGMDIRLRNGRPVQADYIHMAELYAEDEPRYPDNYDEDELLAIHPDFDTALEIVEARYEEWKSKSANAFRNAIESTNDAIRMRFQTAYLALRDENGRVIGLISGLIDGNTAEIRYYVDEEYRGNGLTAQAVPGFMRQFASDFGIDTFYMEFGDQFDVEQSAAVARAAGFNLPKDGNDKLTAATKYKNGDDVLGCDISNEWQFSQGKPMANETAVSPSAILLGDQEPYTPLAGAIELDEYRNRSFFLRSTRAQEAMDATAFMEEAIELARRSPLNNEGETDGYWWSCQALAHHHDPEVQQYGLALAREGYQDDPRGLIDTLGLFLKDGIDPAVRQEAINMTIDAIPQLDGYPMHTWRNLTEKHAGAITPEQAEKVVTSIQGMNLWDAYKNLPKQLVIEATTTHVFEAVKAEYDKRSADSHPYYGGVELHMKWLYGRLTPEQQTAVRGWGIKLPEGRKDQ